MMFEIYSLIAFVIFLIYIIKNLLLAFASPLAGIPNAHFTAPFSRCWLLWTRYTGQESTQRLTAHRRHGSIIRLGPTELGVNCIDDGIRTIYGGNFDKASMYANLSNYGFVAPSSPELIMLLTVNF